VVDASVFPSQDAEEPYSQDSGEDTSGAEVEEDKSSADQTANTPAEDKIVSRASVLAKSAVSKRLSAFKRRSVASPFVNSPKRAVPTAATPFSAKRRSSSRLDVSALNISVNAKSSEGASPALKEMEGKFNSEDVEKVPASKLTKSAFKPRSVVKSKVSKVPNFQRIHQKASGKMQNVSDYLVQKKFGSAQKTGTAFVPSVISTKNLQLNFAELSKKKSPSTSTSKPFHRQLTQITEGKVNSRNPTPKSSPASASPALKENIKPRTSSTFTPQSVKKIRTPLFASRGSVSKARPSTGTPRPSLADQRASLAKLRPSTGTPRLSLASPRPSLGKSRPSNGTPRLSLATPRPSLGKPRPLPDTPRPSSSLSRRSPRVSGALSGVKNSGVKTGGAKIVVPVRRNPSKIVPPSKPVALKQMNGSFNKPAVVKKQASAPQSSTDKASKIPLPSKLPRLMEHRKLAQKKPFVKSPEERREETKTYVKGVRTNKRFELLMERRRQMQ